MSRYSSSGSTGHAIQRFGPDDFRLSWVVDFYYSGSRLRWPRRFTRDTDRAGALRFARRWGVQMPPEPRPDPEEVNTLLNALDRERAPQTAEEIGDHPDPPEDRYDRWEP